MNVYTSRETKIHICILSYCKELGSTVDLYWLSESEGLMPLDVCWRISFGLVQCSLNASWPYSDAVSSLIF
jgi:hypothetical protein